MKFLFFRGIIHVAKKPRVGMSYMDPGIIYAPYIPILNTPITSGIEQPVPSRYERIMVDQNLYGSLLLSGTTMTN